MATISEIKQLREQMAAERKAEEAAVKVKISTLSKSSVPDLVALKDHWATEQKRYRKLDEFSSRKRREAEIWLKAIEHILTHPRGAGASTEAIAGNLDTPQAAAYLKVSVSTLYHWTHEGKIPHSTAGSKKLVFAKPDLDAFLRSRRRSTNEDIDRDADRKVGVLRARRSKKRAG